MAMYYLTREEDERLLFSIPLPGKTQYLYEYFLDLPLEDLKEYPQAGYHNWMSRAAKSSQAMELRNYILFWRLTAQKVQEVYSYTYLESLSDDILDFLLHIFLRQIPIWVYEESIRNIMQILSQREKS